jgi:hypothetical protein
VTYLQQLLGQAGYDPGAIDGDFGNGTLRAVQAFQGDNGLAADGVVGPATWAALVGSGDGGRTGQIEESEAVPGELVQAGAPASLSEWTDEQKEAFFNGPVTEDGDAGSPDEVELVAIVNSPSGEDGQIA